MLCFEITVAPVITPGEGSEIFSGPSDSIFKKPSLSDEGKLQETGRSGRRSQLAFIGGCLQAEYTGFIITRLKRQRTLTSSRTISHLYSNAVDARHVHEDRAQKCRSCQS